MCRAKNDPSGWRRCSVNHSEEYKKLMKEAQAKRDAARYLLRRSKTGGVRLSPLFVPPVLSSFEQVLSWEDSLAVILQLKSVYEMILIIEKEALQLNDGRAFDQIFSEQQKDDFLELANKKNVSTDQVYQILEYNIGSVENMMMDIVLLVGTYFDREALRRTGVKPPSRSSKLLVFEQKHDRAAQKYAFAERECVRQMSEISELKASSGNKKEITSLTIMYSDAVAYKKEMEKQKEKTEKIALKQFMKLYEQEVIWKLSYAKNCKDILAEIRNVGKEILQYHQDSMPEAINAVNKIVRDFPADWIRNSNWAKDKWLVKEARSPEQTFIYRVEQTTPMISRLEKKLWNKRCRNDDGTLCAQSSYRGNSAEIITVESGFLNEYATKHDEQNNTLEILACGIQAIYNGQNGCLSGVGVEVSDSEHRIFTLGVLATV